MNWLLPIRTTSKLCKGSKMTDGKRNTITNICVLVAVGSALLMDSAGSYKFLVLMCGMIATIISVCVYFSYWWSKEKTK